MQNPWFTNACCATSSNRWRAAPLVRLLLCRRGDFLRHGSSAGGRGGDLELPSIQRQSGVEAWGELKTTTCQKTRALPPAISEANPLRALFLTANNGQG